MSAPAIVMRDAIPVTVQGQCWKCDSALTDTNGSFSIEVATYMGKTPIVCVNCGSRNKLPRWARQVAP